MSKPLVLLLLSSLILGRPALCQTKDTQEKTTITVHLNEVYQTIHSFGASDCWTTKFVGKWPDSTKKNQVADWLFSMDTLSDGSPRGIGLSLWRFNIGSGSYEQGKASNIPDEWRREECFLNEDGNYNWEKQQGQQWFLNAAKQRGVKYSLGFSIAPPVFMAANGKAYNGTGATGMNIRKNKMQAYAGFMAMVAEHFKFDYLSPVNEPQWSWGKDRISQEGTQATNSEIAELVKLLSKKLSIQNSRTEVVIGEAGQWNFLYENDSDNRGDQIRHFFSPASANYIGRLPNVAHTISAHSYFTTCPDTELVNVRRRVAEKVKQVDASLKLWQTEFGILGNICNQLKGGPRNTGIDYGLYVARVIHHDLTIANVSSWQWWLAVSPYNYSDALVYVNDLSGKMNVNNCKEDGIVLDSKQLWSFGNFARFVRPGMKRIGVSVTCMNDPVVAAGSLMVSAYKEEETQELVLVIVNPKAEEQVLQLKESKEWKISGNYLTAYTTNATNNLTKSMVSVDSLKIPAKSVVTLTGTYE